ncbi:hypothetical protein NDU88_002564 [Pleurodeles waltl]|uniref:Uncharacterized protein n=1 Tax=Pleurodeles waltl TaxID=8319 RepID=A0AAV7MN19_PLEWA|nr:hypothetical protein NDU88_002564 [Pleurodeles waltl]
MTAAAILAFPLGWQATARRPPAGPAGKRLQRGSRLRMEPAEFKACDGAHAIGMGTAGAPRGPTTPVTAILFLAVKAARNRMAHWVTLGFITASSSRQLKSLQSVFLGSELFEWSPERPGKHVPVFRGGE